MVARVKSMGEWVMQRFTARPAIVYTLDGGQLFRFAPDKRVFLYHAAVCPRRQVVVAGGTTVQCDSCLTSLIWALSPAGHRMPIDYVPVTVYTMNESTVVPYAEEYEAFMPLYLSHFASCTRPASYSKGRSR
jgi:hypothetical protein